MGSILQHREFCGVSGCLNYVTFSSGVCGQHEDKRREAIREANTVSRKEAREKAKQKDVIENWLRKKA